MKNYFIAAAILLFLTASAQDLKSFKTYLSEPVQVDSLTTIYSTVQVTEHNDAAKITERTAAHSQTTINGYRIMLFISNSQSARTDAFAACDSLAVRLPNLPTYVSYDNPYFKVAAGNCTTQEEALILLEQIKPSFPKAFIMREAIPLTELSK